MLFTPHPVSLHACLCCACAALPRRVSTNARVSPVSAGQGVFSKDPPTGTNLDLSNWKMSSMVAGCCGRPYKKRLVKGDPGFIDVPASWRCVRNPMLKGQFRKERGGTCRNGYFLQFSYNDAFVARDVAAGYKSKKYPWITAVYRIQIPKQTPMDSEASWFSFPPHAEPGRYVIQWWWRGPCAS